jgi:hypothetical protein
MLYHRTDDVERMQKGVADTEQQFADCLQQIKTLGEEKERRQKKLEDLRGAAKTLVDMVDPPEEGEGRQVPHRSPGRMCQPRPHLCKILLAGGSTRDVCVGSGCGVH